LIHFYKRFIDVIYTKIVVKEEKFQESR